MQDHLGQVGRAQRHQPFSHGGGNGTVFLAEHKHMHSLGIRAGCFQQIAMSARERIGVHHHAGRLLPGYVSPMKLGQPVRKARFSVFQKGDFIRAGNLIKAQILKKARRLGLCIQKEARVAARCLHLAQVRNHQVHQSFAAAGVIYRQTAKGRAAAAACGAEHILLIIHAAGIIRQRIAAQPAAGKKGVHRGQTAPGGNGSDGIGHSGRSFHKRLR